jgi:tRNA pseudouridine38-40 synthase
MNAIDPRKVQLMRAARTDKGVHASCNLVSLKMLCHDTNIIQKLNQILPEHIRIWGNTLGALYSSTIRFLIIMQVT